MSQEDGVVRQIRGRPRPPMSENELLEWCKLQYAALGLKGPIHDSSGNKLAEIPDRRQAK